MRGCAPALDAGKIVQKKLTKINLLKEPPDKSFHPSSCPLLWFSVQRGIILRFSLKGISAFSFHTED